MASEVGTDRQGASRVCAERDSVVDPVLTGGGTKLARQHRRPEPATLRLAPRFSESARRSTIFGIRARIPGSSIGVELRPGQTDPAIPIEMDRDGHLVFELLVFLLLFFCSVRVFR